MHMANGLYAVLINLSFDSQAFLNVLKLPGFSVHSKLCCNDFTEQEPLLCTDTVYGIATFQNLYFFIKD